MEERDHSMVLFVLKYASILCVAVAAGALLIQKGKESQNKKTNRTATTPKAKPQTYKPIQQNYVGMHQNAADERNAALAELEKTLRRKAELDYNMAFGKVFFRACAGLQQLFARRNSENLCSYVLTDGENSGLFALSRNLPGEIKYPVLPAVGENVTAEQLRFTAAGNRREYSQLEKEPDWKTLVEGLLPHLEALRQTALLGNDEDTRCGIAEIERFLRSRNICPVWFSAPEVQADIHLQMDFIRGNAEIPVLYLKKPEGLRRISKPGCTSSAKEENL